MWRLFERKNEKEMKETKEKDKDQQKESWSLPGCSGHCLEPQTTIYKWMFGETTIFYKKDLESSNWNNHLE